MIREIANGNVNEERWGTTPSGGIRKKVTGVRAWLVVDGSGEAQVVEVGKYAIMRRTGLPARDLRILDPLLSYPSTFLGRERAIVINLEHIKAIITAHEVLLLNSRDPSVTLFGQQLQARILHHHHHGCDHGRNKILPFEFVALEVCLEAGCSVLEKEAKTLEEEAHPILDKLTSEISTLNLERVRQIKSRLVAITGRVQKVRDELEHLLDDDEDMAEMYLSDKFLQQQQLEQTSSSSTGDVVVGDQIDNEEEEEEEDNDDAASTTYSATTKHLDVQELEMLLEAYFVQIDGTLNNLSTLREYVDDTEDYINIMLDDTQNRLLQTGVTLTTATMVVNAFIVLVGIFGMNIHIDLFDSDMTKFLWTVGGGTAGSIFLYVVAITWYKYKRLLE